MGDRAKKLIEELAALQPAEIDEFFKLVPVYFDDAAPTAAEMAELRRRAEEVRRGEVVCVDIEEAIAEARARLSPGRAAAE